MRTLIFILFISVGLYAQDTDISRGMTPTQMNTIINANILEYEDAFGVPFSDTLTITGLTMSEYITQLNWNLDTIAVLCGVSITEISARGTGSLFRLRVNNAFDDLAASSEYLAYVFAFRMSTTYTGAITNDEIQFRIADDSDVKITWGDGTSTTLTGTGAIQSVTTPYTVTPSVNEIRVTGDLDEIQSFKFPDNNFLEYEGDRFKYMTSLDTIYMVAGVTTNFCDGDINCTNLTYIYDYNNKVNYSSTAGTIDNTNFPNMTSCTIGGTASWLIDFHNLPPNIEYIYTNAHNPSQAEQTIDSLPTSLTQITLNTSSIYVLTGNFANVHDGFRIWDSQGPEKNGASFTMDLDSLPTSIYHICATEGDAANPWKGSIDSLYKYGDFTSLDMAVVSGNISGSIDNLAMGLTINGTTTIDGDYANYDRSITILALIDIGNGITGGLEDVSVNTKAFSVVSNTSFTYSSGVVPDFVTIGRLKIQNSWTGGQVDACLNALSATGATAVSPYEIDLAGTNAARSAASDAAVTDLESRGWTVTTN